MWLGSKCIMWLSESEHVLIWKHVLLEITFLSFPCQHKYLSKPVSGTPFLPVVFLRQKEKKRQKEGGKRCRRKERLRPLTDVCLSAGLYSAAITRTTHMQTDPMCVSNTSRSCLCDRMALQASCYDSSLHALRDLIWGVFWQGDHSE